MKKSLSCSLWILFLLLTALIAVNGAFAAGLNQPPGGFTALFNGNDLTGWWGFNADPRKYWALSEEDRARKREELRCPKLHEHERGYDA